jgi:hypothetical protein
MSHKQTNFKSYHEPALRRYKAIDNKGNEWTIIRVMWWDQGLETYLHKNMVEIKDIPPNDKESYEYISVEDLELEGLKEI